LFLDPPEKQPTHNIRPATGITARTNVGEAIKQLTATGCKPLKTAYVVDIDSSTHRMKWMKDVSPCITRCRAAGHWVTSRGRRFTKDEMMRLQGMAPEKFKQVVPDVQLGKQIGNSMSVNVLERLFVRALPAAKLVDPRKVTDRWAQGKPPAEMTRAAARKGQPQPRKRAALTRAAARKGQPQPRKRAATQNSSSPKKRART